MSEGPTTVGSIIAKMKMDLDQWRADRAAVNGEAAQLGALEPTITVDVNSAAAMAKMAAVNAAEKKLDIANQQLQLSYLRLDEAQSKGGVSAAKLAALHLAAARAENTHQAATEKLAAAQLALSAADDEEEHSESKANATHGTTISRMGLIVAAIAALIPMLAALSGYAVGVAGSLAGMAGAGILAVFGIKQAMTAANLEGRSFSNGLQTLKSDFLTLADTASSGMLDSFQQAVAMIDGDMPSLNTQIGTFSQMLGTVGTTILGGVLNAFKVMNPLFVQAGQYVESLASGFKKWTEDGGLQKFTAYAQQSLPKVADTLGALATAILHIIEATAPIGTVTLGVLTALSEAISGIPTPVLTSLVVVAGTVFTAISAWKTLAPTIKAVSAALKGLGAAQVGMLGLAGAAILVTQALANFGASQLGGLVNDLTGMSGALEKVNSAISSGKLGTATAQFHQLQSSLDTTKGSLGGFMGTLVDMSNTFEKMGPIVSFFAGPTQALLQSTVGKSSKAVDGYKAALKAQKQQQDDAVKSGIDYANATSLGGSVSRTMAEALGMTVTGYDQMISGMNRATAAAKTWQTELDILNGGTQSLEQANINLAADFQNMADTVAKSIKDVGTAQATSLDINTKTGNQNHQMILQQVQDAQTQSDAIIASEGNTAQAREHGRLALVASKQAIEDHLVALGFDKGAVDALVESELKVPAQVTTKFTLDGVAAGTQQVSDYLRLVNSIHDITQRITVEAVYVGGAQNLATTGGTKAAFATGGTVPGSGSGDTYEALLTPGEEVIKPGPASKYRNLLKAINAGGDPLSAAGMVASRNSMTQTTTPSVSSLPPIYVQNPFTGEYLLAQVSHVADGRIAVSASQQGSALANGVRPLA